MSLQRHLVLNYGSGENVQKKKSSILMDSLDSNRAILSSGVMGNNEIVWYSTRDREGKTTGSPQLVYHFDGVAQVLQTDTTKRSASVRFDAFVDANSGEIIHFIDKTSKWGSNENLMGKKKAFSTEFNSFHDSSIFSSKKIRNSDIDSFSLHNRRRLLANPSTINIQVFDCDGDCDTGSSLIYNSQSDNIESGSYSTAVKTVEPAA